MNFSPFFTMKFKIYKVQFFYYFSCNLDEKKKERDTERNFFVKCTKYSIIIMKKKGKFCEN